MTEKIRVGILFGGQSAEHEISLQSAKNIVAAIDTQKYEVVLIGIDKSGGWHLQSADRFLLHATNPELIRLNVSSEDLAIIPEKQAEKFLSLSQRQPIGQIDVIFPVLHGLLWRRWPYRDYSSWQIFLLSVPECWDLQLVWIKMS